MEHTTKIGIIGRGNVGSALERGLSRAGYAVQTTGRDPATVQEVGRWADLLLLAVPYGERKSALKELGDTVRGKTLVDATNAVDGKMQYAGSLDRSGAEEVQGLARGAHVVKAFNTVFAQNMDSGQVAGEPLALFAAGDDAQAKQAVLEMGQAIGFDPVDAGPLEHARWLEPLGYLNIALGVKANHGRNSGFRFLHAQADPSPARGARPTPNAPRHERERLERAPVS
jgi:predicted dinucleotide-binding enzyme